MLCIWLASSAGFTYFYLSAIGDWQVVIQAAQTGSMGVYRAGHMPTSVDTSCTSTAAVA
jgi:hypothetical protein